MGAGYHLRAGHARPGPARRGSASSALGLAALAAVTFGCSQGGAPADAPTRPIPVATIEVSAGRALFVQHCSSCHGDGGAGDGPEAARGASAPDSFLEPDLVADLSPSAAYVAITDGVEGTEMRSFDALPSRDRWVLAYFVVAMRHDEAAGSQALAVAAEQGVPLDPSSLALLSERDVHESLRELPQAQHREAHAALRWLAPQSDGGPLSAVREHLAAVTDFYREGRPREAREALARARTRGAAPMAPIARLAAPELEAGLEWQLSGIRGAIEVGDPSLQIEQRATGAAVTTRRIETALAAEESGPMVAARSAAVMIGSSIDGVALLLLLIGAAHFTGRRRERAWIYTAAGIALIAGLGLGSSSLPGNLTTTLEGVVSIASAIALIAATPVAIRRIFRPGERRAISTSFTAFLSAGALVSLFRDAASAAPSLAHLAASSPTATIAGAGAALISLALLAVGVGSLSARLSPGIAAIGFSLCATVVLAMSLGNGIHALQAIGAAPETALGQARSDWLAFYPTVQTIVAQAIAPAILAAVLAYSGLKVLSGSR